jgi:peptide/nickel transport system permease protein
LTEQVSHSVFQKLRRKKPALVAMLIIAATVLVAAGAYLLAPDKSPDANAMVLELASKSPGFRTTLLCVPKQQAPAPAPALQALFMGTPDPYQYLPVNQYTCTTDGIRVHHYIDDQIEDTLFYKWAELVPPALRQAPAAEQQAYVRKHQLQQRTYYLGSDRYGRDILSRLLIGSRVSIAVGLVAVLLSLSIGVVLGAIAGYFGGRIDALVMFVINIFWSVPTLLLVFAITLSIGKGFWEIFIAIGLTMWVGAARLVRGQVLALREMEYVTAAKSIGAGHFRIIRRHILPNIAGPLMVIAASNFAAAILIEAGLSFLGIGIQPPQPSWGLMIKEHYNFLITNQPLSAIIPGLAIMLLVYAFNILGNALRDVLDVRS